jgi:hypothetical protein
MTIIELRASENKPCKCNTSVPFTSILRRSQNLCKRMETKTLTELREFDYLAIFQQARYRLSIHAAGGRHICFRHNVHAGRRRWCRKRRGLHNTQETQRFRHSRG